MKTKNVFSVGLVLVAGMVAAATLFFPSVADARDIKVGIVDTYSGPAAVFGNDALNGFKLAVDEINKQGVLGGKIVFTTRDEQFKVDIALSMAKELVLKENVDVLVGTINSGASMAISEAVAKKEKIPFIVWTPRAKTSPARPAIGMFFPRPKTPPWPASRPPSRFPRNPYKKFWIAGDDYEYGHAIADAVWRNLKQDQTRRGDHRQILVEARRARPDPLPHGHPGRQARLHHFRHRRTEHDQRAEGHEDHGHGKKIPVWIHTATDHSVLKPLGMEAPEGVMGTIEYHFYYPDSPPTRSLLRTFRPPTATRPASRRFNAYTTAQFIAEGFRKAGKIDQEKFIDALEGLKVDTPVGKVEMRACDHQASIPCSSVPPRSQGIRVRHCHGFHHPARGRGHAFLRGDRRGAQAEMSVFPRRPAGP